VFEQSREIIKQARMEYKPYAAVAMFSGGTDSLTALHVALRLGVKVDYVMHVHTGTGIPETLDYVRRYVESTGLPYIERTAGSAYEDYVLRKGFFGKGERAHTYAYHILKRQRLRAGLATIRQGKRGRNILLINGGRRQESQNRMMTMREPVKADGPNVWVNIINEWTKRDCMDFIHDEKLEVNPVSALLHRSGECMCGTMQNKEEREEAAFWFPHWGAWLDGLEQCVNERGFWWKWGQSTPEAVGMMKRGQLAFQPLCVGCINKHP
jgi:3'-phosphoadenosine 5'-phosphosulfate sulfotransferase (PAPS reductase)/FAD synthetase